MVASQEQSSCNEILRLKNIITSNIKREGGWGGGDFGNNFDYIA